MHDLADQRVTVAGLGRFGGGIAAARWLIEQGARVLVTDEKPAGLLADSVEQLQALPIAYHLGGHREEDFTNADLVVASPAIPRSSQFLRAAVAAGVPVTTEICLFIERCPASTVIGVTGTKGKSTTTAMLGEILRPHNATWIGGNLGGSLLAELPRIQPRDWVVLELSSYMLDYLGERKWSPHIGIITMITADHLAWHGSVEAYVDAKKNLLRYQTPADFAVLNRENEATWALADEVRATVAPFGVEHTKHFEMALPGSHNQLNAQAAFAAAHLLGVTWEQAQEVLRNFHGLPHRLELVHEANDVRFVNDSIATIPEAAVAALESFPARKVIQIVGGSDKGLSITELCAALTERAKAVLCIGATGTVVAEKLAASTYHAAAPVHVCGDLATAMQVARSIATPGDVILLSPGFASYDQFVNFEERGNTFVRLAKGA